MINRLLHTQGKLIFAALSLLALASCVTQKSRDEELSGLGKLYHNTTAKFNGYFNANEIMEESILALDEQHLDNYKTILPVYEYVATENPQSVASNLDLAIEKVTIVVNLHRKSHWTDDCYLLLGQAQYLKQDYESAEETLRWMTNEFSPEKMAKEQEKAKSKKGDKKEEPVAERREDGVSDAEQEVAEMTEKEKRQYYRDAEKERKRYNREVKRRRKQARKGKAPKKTTPVEEAPVLPETLPEETLLANANANAADSSVAPGLRMVSLEDSPGPGGVEPDPDSYFLKHRPAYQEGVLWLARTYIERQRYDEALRLMVKLEGDPFTFDDIREDLSVVRAHFYIAQKEYDAALPYLQQAIESAGRRSDKARYAFIEAQIHHRAGRDEQAFAAFDQSLHFGPTYEMAFNGQLYLIDNGWKKGTYTTQDARDQLEKMARDFKNEEFRDQIFYALANIELQAGNRDTGIQYLRASLAESRGNSLQRAESYMRLANLYLDDENFIPAQAYFDSTMQVLPTNDERYPDVKTWAENLSGIAQNLQLIETQDSLLRIANLSPAEQQALAFEIKKKRDNERLAALTQQNSQAANSLLGNNGLQPRANNLQQVNLSSNASQQGQTASSFFAYDDRSLKRGQREFSQKWGSRSLEDDWRRTNKQALPEFATKESQTEDVVPALPEDEISSILKDVPQTPEDIAKAEGILQQAMFDLGILYRDNLDDNRRSIEVLEDLDGRFKEYELEPDALYYLYLNYSELGQDSKAQQYASRIHARFPSSVYAKVLKNPNYAQEVANEEHRLNQYYEGTYAAFKKGLYQEAFVKSEAAAQQFGADNVLQPKFALLMAMCSGQLEGKEFYIANLRDLISRYPNTPEQTRAREILRLLGEQPAAVDGVTPDDLSRYEANDNEQHYIVVLFHDNIRLDNAQVDLSNYNLEYHKLDRLRINNLYLGSDDSNRLPMLIVRRFKDKNAAMTYYEGATKNAANFIDPSLNYSIFAVNQHNYREILRSRSISGYQEFFNQNYLQ